MAKDLYDILGVAKSASADEIKSAYRALARRLHPDVNKAADATSKFAEVQNAYDVLSDEKKRRMYDRFGEAGLHMDEPSASRPGRGGGRGGSGGVHSGGGAGGGGGGAYGGPMGDGVEFDPEDLSSMFETFFGGGSGRPGRARGGRRGGGGGASAPEPVRAEVRVDFIAAAQGGTQSVRVERGGRVRTIEVTIPAGVPDGAQLRVKGEGGDGGGDLLLTVRIGEHPLFRRGEGALSGRSLDLYVDLPLTIAEATFGAEVEVPTLEGKVQVRVPPGTTGGRRLRVKGHGIRAVSGTTGDLYAVAQVVAPAPGDLSEAEAEVIRRVGEKQGNVRQGPAWM
ncbi:MAG: DnaJ domain-containing protein [Phycisphaeraceae bacterium]|nr:MAG: DnaJ domain-containing protein [Phycisphaeraceae bacterium]